MAGRARSGGDSGSMRRARRSGRSAAARGPLYSSGEGPPPPRRQPIGAGLAVERQGGLPIGGTAFGRRGRGCGGRAGLAAGQGGARRACAVAAGRGGGSRCGAGAAPRVGRPRRPEAWSSPAARRGARRGATGSAAVRGMQGQELPPPLGALRAAGPRRGSRRAQRAPVRQPGPVPPAVQKPQRPPAWAGPPRPRRLAPGGRAGHG